MTAAGAPWLDVVGIGADGPESLSAGAKRVLAAAEIIVGAERHHTLTAHLHAERLSWPSPFDALIGTLRAHRGRAIVVLVTGDPLWYSLGARLLKDIPAPEIRFWPQLSAFQWASCRLGWSLADVETLTVHGRNVEQSLPFIGHGQRLLVLANNERTPRELSQLLHERGFGPSRLIALGWLGDVDESRHEGLAEDWARATPPIPAFHTLAIEAHAAYGAHPLPRIGLPDHVFLNDGKMTKRELRALAIAALAPRRGETLWDVGAGCGSISVEWMRADRDMSAFAIEPQAGRREMIRANAQALGAPRIEIVAGRAPEALAALPPPHAVFIGGGLAAPTFDAAMAALQPFGRLVAHAVTLESEALLMEGHARLGGGLTRLQVSRAGPVGEYRGWKPAMPVTQWTWMKPAPDAWETRR